MYIDPAKVTDFNRNSDELEAFLLFSIVVAGKTARVQAEKLNRFLLERNDSQSPFQYIQNLVENGLLESKLREVGLGQYNRLVKSFTHVLKLDPKTASTAELESIYGISSKTSRFFLIHSRPNQKFAALDTHILAHLRENGFPEAPKTTPTGVKYRFYEEKFLDMVEKSGMSVADYDLMVWRARSKRQ